MPRAHEYCRVGLSLRCLVELEEAPGFIEVEEVSVDDELPFACVRGNLVDALDGVAVLSKLFDKEIDVNHGDHYTQGLLDGERLWAGFPVSRGALPYAAAEGGTPRLKELTQQDDAAEVVGATVGE